MLLSVAEKSGNYAEETGSEFFPEQPGPELPAEQRTVFELMELEGLSVKEVAEATGASANTVLSRKHYAVKHLRKRLEGLYNDILTY